jgi:hypothetical protein
LRGCSSTSIERPSGLEQLDFLYTPSRDVAADARYFTEVLGARLAFAVEGMGARVAQVELTTIPIYRVADLGQTLVALEARGWSRESTFEIPQGPCCSFQTPGGQRIALYELTRPEAASHFLGRRDF